MLFRSQAQGWAYNTAKKALGELTQQELARVVSKGAPARYALADRSLLGASVGLLDPAELVADAAQPVANGHTGTNTDPGTAPAPASAEAA